MVSETMAVQEEHGCRGLDSCLPTSGNTSLDLATTIVQETQSEEQPNNPGDDFAPKVRKPYTITKQREKWTEEEHKKFLEALRLYGRAWRRIEEHVGSKTAVQIRSHAQKFFSKVTRETNIGDGNYVKPIEIPPPRPKRKPMHPYPRKMVSQVKNVISIPEKFPNAMDQENQSPISVLSGIGSDSSGGSDPCTPNGNRSSVSSDVPKLVSEDAISLLPEREGENSSTDERMHMESGISSQNDAFVKEETDESGMQSLKLFGKTLLIMGPIGLPDPVSEDCRTELLLDRRGENCSLTWGVLPVKIPSGNCVWNVFSDVSSNVVADCGGLSSDGLTSPISFPWLTLSTNNSLVQHPEVHSPTPIRARSLCDNNNNNTKEKADDNEKEGLLVGPSFSFSQKGSGKSFLPYKSSKKRISGFVPYKRCSDKRGSTLLQAESGKERETQRVRLCL